MDTILRGVATYLFLLLIFRLSGKRSLAQITTFDAILVLIISEAIQEALIGGDPSMTNAFLLVVTLLGLDMLMQSISARWQAADKLLNSVPLVLIEDGQVLQERLAQMRVTEDDILEEARRLLGIERLEQIKYAVLERNGGITIIPRRVSWAAPDPAPDEIRG